MRIIKNQDIRDEIKNAGIKLWQIADKLGIDDSNFSRKLRYELNDETKQKIRTIINELKAGADNE